MADVDSLLDDLEGTLGQRASSSYQSASSFPAKLGRPPKPPQLDELDDLLGSMGVGASPGPKARTDKNTPSPDSTSSRRSQSRPEKATTRDDEIDALLDLGAEKPNFLPEYTATSPTRRRSNSTTVPHSPAYAGTAPPPPPCPPGHPCGSGFAAPGKDHAKSHFALSMSGVGDRRV
eukprot:gene1931-2979_t